MSNQKRKIETSKAKSEVDCLVIKKICGESSQFILSENYPDLIKDIINFPGGHEYFLKPKYIYIDEVEAEDGYYTLAIDYFGLGIRDEYIRGLDIIANSLSPGFVGLLWRYGFVLDSVDFGRPQVFKFDHIAFV
jgi:hypothetical protein